MKKILFFLIFLLTTAGCLPVLAETEALILIDEVRFGVTTPVCGQIITSDEQPDAYVDNEEDVVLGTPCIFVSGYDMEEITPFSGRVTGGGTYTVYLTLEAEPGYAFAENVSVSCFDTDTYEDTAVEPFQRNEQKVVIVLTRRRCSLSACPIRKT